MKKLFKKLTLIIASISLIAATAGCGTKAKTDDNTIVIGASPAPHAEILEFAKPLLEAKGIKLDIKIFTDYVLPNTSLDSGDLDANYFQHLPYLEDFNAKNGTEIVSVGNIHFEPLGIYPGKSSDLKNIKDGATISVPSDATNEARALQLLESLELIKLKDGAGLEATPRDIVENPHQIVFKEIEAAQVPRTLADVDFGIANGNYALEAEIANTVLTAEDKTSEGAQKFANIVAVKKGNENNPAIKALIEVLNSKEVTDFINEKYQGIVVPLAE